MKTLEVSIHSDPAAAPGARALPANYAWYVLILLTGANLVYFIDRTVVAILMEPIKKEFALTDFQLGLLMGPAYSVPYLLAGIPLGLLADRVNRVRLLAFVMTVWSGFTLICGLAQSFTMLLLARMCVGAAEAGGVPTCLSILSDYFRKEKRSTAAGIWHMGAPIGMAVTLFLGGYIAHHYGWRMAFFIAGAPGLILMALIFMTVREPTRGSMDASVINAGGKAPSLWQTLKFLFRKKGIPHLYMGAILSAFVTGGIAGFLSSFLVREHGVPISTAGFLLGSIFFTGALTGSFAGGLVGDRLSRTPGGHRPSRAALVSVSGSLMAMLLGWAAFISPDLSVCVVLLGLYLAFQLSATVPGHSVIMTVLPAEMRGAGVGLMTILMNVLGSGIGVFSVGTISHLIGGPHSIKWALMVVLGANLWAAFHFLLAAKYIDRQPVAGP